MVTTRWFAYALLLAVAFAVGLIGTVAASRALTPAQANPVKTPVSTTPASTIKASAAHLIEC